MAEENGNFSDKTPFENEKEYMEDFLMLQIVRLQYFYRQEVLRVQGGRGVVNKFSPSPLDIGEILQQKFDGNFNAKDLSKMTSWEHFFASRKEISKEQGFTCSWMDLEVALHLTEFGQSALAFSLLVAMDSDYRCVFQFLQSDEDKAYPTPELCARIYFNGQADNTMEAYQMSAPYMEELMLLFPGLARNNNPYGAQLIPDQRLLAMAVQEKSGNCSFPSYMKIISTEEALPPLLHRETELITLENMAKEEACLWALFKGEAGAGKTHLAAHFCRRKKIENVVLDLNLLGADKELEDVWAVAVDIICREAMYRKAAITVCHLDSMEKESAGELVNKMRKKEMNGIPAVFFTCSERTVTKDYDHVFVLELAEFDENQRREIWEHYAKEDALEGVTLSSVANTFIFTPGQITAALETARMMAASVCGSINKERLYKACYVHVDHSLSEKAKRIKAVFTWDDLKLQQEEKDLLRDICNRVKNKHIVFSEWGFSDVLPYGSGLSAVFAGPPGTGKTMAAQVIANELGMEMYQIDLSQVVDKYIGETEKNIKMIFEQARRSNSILFFDEADSLFAKRVDSKSSNDRFANIESSLLLQCLEEYSGISILATNNYTTIDPAFVRRFKYLVNFRLPDAKARLEIWQSVFPKGTPLSEEVDLVWIAEKFSLSGAYIKNIALAAAFLAAEEKCQVGNLHILKGLSREMSKEGRKLEQEQLSHLGYLYDEL